LDNKSTINKLSNKFSGKYLKGDGKIFFIVFFVLVLLLLIGILAESYIGNVKEDWNSIVTEEINDMQKTVIEEFNKKENLLFNTLYKLKSNLQKELSTSNETFKSFIKEINHKEYDDFSIEIYAPNGKLIGWNKSSNFINNELFPLPSSIGESFFLEKELVYCYSIVDTFHFQSDEFYILLSLPLEKKYKLHNKYYEEISIINSITDKIQTEVKVDFNPFTSSSIDGRKYSFEITNNKNRKIGLVTLNKPTIKSRINEIKNFTSSLQSLIVLFGLIVIGFGLRKDYLNLSSYFAKFSFLLFYLILFRILLYIFSIPSKFLDSPITDATNFSSTFGYGLVKSPLEFFITNLFVSIAALQFFRYSLKFSREDKYFKSSALTYSIVILFLVLFPLLLRAFAASIRSVVFDSKLRYFKDFEILPDFTVLVMHTNILLIGISFLFVLIGLTLVLKKLLTRKRKDFKRMDYLIITLLMSISSVTFYLVSQNPLYNIINLFVLLITILWIFFFLNRYNTNIYRYYVIILFVASLNSVILLNYFDTLRERESVKNIAFEINRLNEQLIRFYLEDNINQIFTNQSEQNLLLRKDINFNSLAFINWTRSNLHQEELNSYISIYDRSGKLLGGFNAGFDYKDNIKNLMTRFNDLIFLDESNPDSLIKKVSAYSKYIEQGVPQLVVSSGIDFEITKLGGLGFPDFLKSDLNIINQYINLEKVKIFQFKDEQLVQYYGDVYPNREQIKHLIELKLDSVFNDSWTKLKFGQENYEAYLIKYYENENEITNVIAVADNKFSWSLFNFFKVFIIHSILIFIVILILSLFSIKKFSISFKSKLLFLFLIISILPLTFLGLYNRNILEERSSSSIKNELKQKLTLVESNLTSLFNQTLKLEEAAKRVNKSLNVAFNLYDGTNLLFTSEKQFYDIGLLNEKINSLAYYNINYDKFREYYAKEKIENYYFQSYYKVIKLKDKQYILNVNQAFNKSNNLISTSDFDIVLFGIYSLTIVIIIFSSTLLANQISSPIQRLTKAAEALGKGDLNVKIEHNEKGEIKELLDGFNKMTDELRKNQIELTQYERESAWKDMAKQVAHEIKNPLTPMKLTLQQLIVTFKEKREDFDKLFEKVSSTILNQIENLNQIASEFSRVAKMPSINLEKFDLLKLLNELSLIYINEKIKINIISDFDELLIENDKNQLSRIFINLIRNSIQASANSIKIIITKANNYLEIIFEDNGKGIKKEFQNKIFDGNFSTKNQGMGLGLKITKKFLNSINGDVVLVSSSEKGTKFKIILPYDKI